jgi:hypothetical protein
MVEFRKVFWILAILVALTGIVSAQAPVVKPQPNEKVYGVGEIYTFKSFTRDSYEKEFGVQPPPFNAAKPVKSWFDNTVTSASVTYLTLDLNTLKNVNLTLTKEDAKSVNLQGAYRYTSYIVKPSECLSQPKNIPMPPSQINTLYLSERKEAEQLATELSGIVALATEPGGQMSAFLVSCPETDTRNVWEVVIQGQHYLAGQLLAQKNQVGIGAPGAWVSTSGTPTWKPENPVISSNNYMRVPVRALYPNEKYSQTPFGTYVNRTDMDDPNGGGFLLSDRATLNEILRIVRDLQTKVK